MEHGGMAWIYLLFFLVIPLSRILPRLIRKWKEKNRGAPEQFTQEPYRSTSDTITESSREAGREDVPREAGREDIPREMKPQTLDMLVLGELNRGIKNFNSIQRNLGIDSKPLEEALQSLEKQGLMKIENKQGLLGPKIVLTPTDKGFKKFYS